MNSFCYYKETINNYHFTIVEENNFITNLTLDDLKLDYPYYKSPLIKKTIKELEEYFHKSRTFFDIPIKLKGTNFQKEVWNALLKIKYGETLSYKDIAKLINNPKATRAIGGAIHNNPLLIIVPCHRVLAQNGLGGFKFGLDMKKELLELEDYNRKRL